MSGSESQPKKVKLTRFQKTATTNGSTLHKTTKPVLVAMITSLMAVIFIA